ncbi:MAG TPA: tetratricopeptide repeat protein [Gemmatimonadaceae bacterium]|nr:tetratricopeptide repeat protein [Gemmatimonadaceae bacterium]
MAVRRIVWALPLATVVSAGCFATRNDVRLLQADMTRLHAAADSARKADAAQARADAAKRDSIHAEEVKSLTAANRALLDSLFAFRLDFMRFGTNTREYQRQQDEQITTIMEMVGVSQKSMADIRNRMESQRASATANPGDSAAMNAGPSPARMFQTGMEQLQNGATGSARMVFQEFLSTYKTDSLVPLVMLKIGSSYEIDKMDAAADSVYALVIQQFSKSDAAATAMYKRGVALEAAGKPREARAMYAALIREHPTAMEKDLASARLKAIPPAP